jgi:hypothetical protein
MMTGSSVDEHQDLLEAGQSLMFLFFVIVVGIFKGMCQRPLQYQANNLLGLYSCLTKRQSRLLLVGLSLDVIALCSFSSASPSADFLLSSTSLFRSL